MESYIADVVEKHTVYWTFQKPSSYHNKRERELKLTNSEVNHLYSRKQNKKKRNVGQN